MPTLPSGYALTVGGGLIVILRATGVIPCM